MGSFLHAYYLVGVMDLMGSFLHAFSLVGVLISLNSPLTYGKS